MSNNIMIILFYINFFNRIDQSFITKNVTFYRNINLIISKYSIVSIRIKFERNFLCFGCMTKHRKLRKTTQTKSCG